MSLSASAVLAGCSLTPTEVQATTPAASTTPSPQSGPALEGQVYGGQQPVVGAYLYVYAAGTGGYGGNGITASSANASVPLLTSSVLTNNPGYSGGTAGHYYVVTNSSGGFSLAGDFTCAAGQQIYLYALGGNPGGGSNADAGFLAAVGECSTIGSNTHVILNEVSTVATAYALAGFATDATHISSSNTALAATGVANAFKTVTNLETLATGAALATTPAVNGGGGTVPQAELNTLANVLAACVNTSPSSSTACSTLLSTATSNGISSGTHPTDTASAAINIAHNPGANQHALFQTTSSSAPFQPSLSSQPNDWTVGIAFAEPTIVTPGQMVIDGSGNIWNVNQTGGPSGGGAVTEISPLGKAATGAPFSDGNMQGPNFMAIDASGNAWVSDAGSPSNPGLGVTEILANGTAAAGSPFNDGSLCGPTAIAVDLNGNLWVGDNCNEYIDVLNTSGASQGQYNANYDFEDPEGMAIDPSGNVWVADRGIPGIILLDSSGNLLNGIGTSDAYWGFALNASADAWAYGYGSNELLEYDPNLNPITHTAAGAGGLNGAFWPAIDGAGNIWIVNNTGNSISEFTSAGTAITSSNGYAPGLMNTANWIAVDGSGNVWTESAAGSKPLVELVGAAAPVVTPTVASILPPYQKAASRP